VRPDLLDSCGSLKLGTSGKLSLMAFNLLLICLRTCPNRSSSPNDETRDREWYSSDSSEVDLRRARDRLDATEGGLPRSGPTRSKEAVVPVRTGGECEDNGGIFVAVAEVLSDTEFCGSAF
jgi:hypothetical protein